MKPEDLYFHKYHGSVTAVGLCLKLCYGICSDYLYVIAIYETTYQIGNLYIIVHHIHQLQWSAHFNQCENHLVHALSPL